MKVETPELQTLNLTTPQKLNVLAPPRSTSRSKGISLNLAVSPVSQPEVHQSQHEQHRERVRQRERDDENYDVPLPLIDQLISLDIDDQLRLLALKEMCIVEIKDNINNLTTRLDKHEKELHLLREVIQKSLYKELTVSSTKIRHQRQNSNPREEAIASTKNRTRRRTLSASYSKTSTNPTVEETPPPPATDSKLWNNLQKPFNLLQQFDTMLQNEFEKSLIPQQHLQQQQQHLQQQQQQQQQQFPQQHLHPESHLSSASSTHESRNSEDSFSSISSSPLKSKSRPLDQFPLMRGRDDMLQTVSTSIWTFVNDVKSNVLSSLSEEESRKDTTLYNLETGSTVSLADPNLDDTLNNSDYELPPEEDDGKIDLSIYSGLRKK